MTAGAGRRGFARGVTALAVALLCVSGSGTAGPAAAAPGEPASAVATEVVGGTPIMLVVDTSGSMANDDGGGIIKMEGAKAALLDLLTRLSLDSQIGLRTYPAKDGTSCSAGRTAVQLAQRNPADMSADIRAITADGDTPTAEALTAAAQDLTSRGYRTGTIVLVSDGEHTCADPCPVARELNAQGLGVTVDTVGFRIDDAGAEELKCISGATGGTYTQVENSAQLGEKLAQLQAPRLELTVGDVATFSPVSEASLTTTATVTNTSAVPAGDVRLALTYDPRSSGGAPAVLTPIRLLGNLEAGGERTVTWQTYPSRVRGSGQLDWTVTMTAAGVPVQARAGITTLTSELDLSAAGPVLSGVDDVVIVGDSYASGEGGGSYTGGACHRSPKSWGRQAFPASVTVHNLACSGAVIADYDNTDFQDLWNPFDNADSQQERLRGLAGGGDVDVVVLTMGGNDIQFAAIVTSCVTTPQCMDFQLCVAGLCGDTLKARTTKLLAGIGPQLRAFYEQVAADSGTDVVVLPYPDLLPNTSRGVRTCTAGLPGFSPAELEFARWVQDELNRQVSTAVKQAAAKGKPVHLARDVQTALQPQHTICDEDPWVVQVTDRMVGIGLDSSIIPDLTIKPSQELVHPDADGYQAMAAALVRWSQSADAPTQAHRRPSSSVSWYGQWVDGWFDAAPVQLDMDRPRDGLQAAAGSRLQVTTGGYLPGSLVVIGVESTPQALGSAFADADGAVTVTVRLPGDLPRGGHTLTASGVSEDGTFQLTPQRLRVTPPLWWPSAATALAALLLVGVGWLVLRIDSRRRRATVQHGSDPR